MAEMKARPEVREISVALRGDRGDETRKGANLNDVLRAILFDMKKAHGWESTTEAAEKLGLTQSTLAAFLDKGGTGVGLETLSRICAALRLSPVELFQRHERYSGGTAFAGDFVYDRFRSVADRGEASRLLRLLEVLKDAGALNSVLAAAERILPIARLRPNSPTGSRIKNRS